MITGLLVSEGDTVQMGAPIAEIEVEGEVAEPKPMEPSEEEQVASTGASSQTAGRVGSMIIGANVGPTGGEFTDTSLQVETAVETDQATPLSRSRRVQRQGRDERGARNLASCETVSRSARHRCERDHRYRCWRTSH